MGIEGRHEDGGRDHHAKDHAPLSAGVPGPPREDGGADRDQRPGLMVELEDRIHPLEVVPVVVLEIDELAPADHAEPEKDQERGEERGQVSLRRSQRPPRFLAGERAEKQDHGQDRRLQGEAHQKSGARGQREQEVPAPPGLLRRFVRRGPQRQRENGEQCSPDAEQLDPAGEEIRPADALVLQVERQEILAEEGVRSSEHESSGQRSKERLAGASEAFVPVPGRRSPRRAGEWRSRARSRGSPPRLCPRREPGGARRRFEAMPRPPAAAGPELRAPLDPAVRQDECRDEVRKRQQVRVQVRVKEREERKLVDRVAVGDHAGGVPVVEVLGKRRGPRVQRAGDVSGEHGRAGGRQPHAQPSTRESESQARGRGEGEPRESRHREVVRDHGRHRRAGGEAAPPAWFARRPAGSPNSSS